MIPPIPDAIPDAIPVATTTMLARSEMLAVRDLVYDFNDFGVAVLFIFIVFLGRKHLKMGDECERNLYAS